ncbi:MAG: A/G-specific adenine glycosylase, partial [Actinomycetota bacterium]|nr:A/G-specific adenine glycosylase [Actinomycetota bacterium]
MSPRLSPATADALLGWFAERRRDLPWRRTRDPWAVLVSELMLQQTQVARVVPRFEVFLSRFPTPSACADASVGDVVTQWAGLGYNRRAVNLHRTATAVVADHGGALPSDLDALLRLPGIGPYTARAVLSFAFERDVGVLDVNATRVLSRAAGRPVAQVEADRLVPPGQGWAWNQAVLDLGATVCRPVPDCGACPLAGGACAWEATGRAAPDPWP